MDILRFDEFNEKLKINSIKLNEFDKIVKPTIKYFPNTKDELTKLIRDFCDKDGLDCDLNSIDTSKITDMNWLFGDTGFCGDVRYWDISNVIEAHEMFYNCPKFNCNLSNWKPEKLKNASGMFAYCRSFDCDLSSWDLTQANTEFMFHACPIKKQYRPKM